MKRLLVVFVATLLVVGTSAYGATASYSWEDGTGTIMGSYGNLVNPTNVTGAQAGSQGSVVGPYTCPGANTGARYLHVAEDPHSGTPQAYIAYVFGLTDGDVIDASFFGYDITPGASPSWRIWGHYATTNSIEDYQGSASGSFTYTDGTGWSQVSHTWTFDSALGTRDALVIEARIYSTPSTSNPDHTDMWADDVSVTTTGGIIHFAPEPTSLALLALGGLIAVRRRR